MFSKDSALRLLNSADVFYGSDADSDSESEEAHTLNMNDTWCWASAWGEEVKDDELVAVATLFWRYGNAGLLYWVSQKHEAMRSEFYDNNRAIEFVENEERIRLAYPNSTARAYHEESYTITGARKPITDTTAGVPVWQGVSNPMERRG
jgi:hypothetical protein